MGLFSLRHGGNLRWLQIKVRKEKSGAGNSKKVGSWASQELAKQKAFEKKSKKYKLLLEELAIFTQQLSSLLTAGLPLVQCLEALQDQTEDQVFRIVV